MLWYGYGFMCEYDSWVDIVHEWLWFVSLVVLLLIILGVQKVDDLIEIRQKRPDRHLWQVVITNSNTVEERVASGRILDLSHTSKMMTNTEDYLQMRTEVFIAYQNMCQNCVPDEIYAGEKLGFCHISGKSLRCSELLSQHSQQDFEYSGKGRTFNTKMIFIHKRSGEPSCKYNEYEETCYCPKDN